MLYVDHILDCATDLKSIDETYLKRADNLIEAKSLLGIAPSLFASKVISAEDLRLFVLIVTSAPRPTLDCRIQTYRILEVVLPRVVLLLVHGGKCKLLFPGFIKKGCRMKWRQPCKGVYAFSLLARHGDKCWPCPESRSARVSVFA